MKSSFSFRAGLALLTLLRRRKVGRKKGREQGREEKKGGTSVIPSRCAGSFPALRGGRKEGRGKRKKKGGKRV